MLLKKTYLLAFTILQVWSPQTPGRAQQVETFPSSDNRSFALVREKVVNANGDWQGTFFPADLCACTSRALHPVRAGWQALPA